MLILGRKACFLGPTIFEIPQPNWYQHILLRDVVRFSNNFKAEQFQIKWVEAYIVGVICPPDWNRVNESPRVNRDKPPLSPDIPPSLLSIILSFDNVTLKQVNIAYLASKKSYCFKGQIISKAIFVFLTSPKKRTKKIKKLTCYYYDISIQIFFVRFLGESRTP